MLVSKTPRQSIVNYPSSFTLGFLLRKQIRKRTENISVNVKNVQKIPKIANVDPIEEGKSRDIYVVYIGCRMMREWLEKVSESTRWGQEEKEQKKGSVVLDHLRKKPHKLLQ